MIAVPGCEASGRYLTIAGITTLQHELADPREKLCVDVRKVCAWGKYNKNVWNGPAKAGSAMQERSRLEDGQARLRWRPAFACGPATFFEAYLQRAGRSDGVI